MSLILSFNLPMHSAIATPQLGSHVSPVDEKIPWAFKIGFSSWIQRRYSVHKGTPCRQAGRMPPWHQWASPCGHPRQVIFFIWSLDLMSYTYSSIACWGPGRRRLNVWRPRYGYTVWRTSTPQHSGFWSWQRERQWRVLWTFQSCLWMMRFFSCLAFLSLTRTFQSSSGYPRSQGLHWAPDWSLGCPDAPPRWGLSGVPLVQS